MGHLFNVFFSQPLKWLHAVAFLFFISTLLVQENAQAACGATNRQWANTGPGNGKWTTTGNWSGGNIPDTTGENAIIVTGGKVPDLDVSESIGCLDLQSGSFTMATAARTLTINGDYFRNLTAGSFTMTTGGTIGITMAGTAAQTFENYDPISNLTISNNTNVTFGYPFTIVDSFTLSGTTSIVYINANLNLSFAGAFTIPAGVTVEIGSGATLTTTGGVTVNGNLVINGGGKLTMANASTLTVGASGLLNLNGTSGNVATLQAATGNTFNLTVNGSMQASNFRIDRIGAAGVNLVGTLIAMSDGEFHNITTKCMTVGAAAVLPSTMANMSFFNELAAGSPINIDATAYVGAGTTLENYGGDIGGEGFDSEPANVIVWGTPAGVLLSLANQTAAGSPAATIGQNVTAYFATFAFSLNQTSPNSTDITSVKFTIDGTATAADVTNIKVYKDAGGGTTCVYDAGVDTLTDTLTVSGSPANATTGTIAGVTTTSTTAACLHVTLTTTATAVGSRTVGVKIASTADVTNSYGYSFSPSSGPPVSAGTSSIIGSPLSTWSGGANPNVDRWTQNSNWLENAAPSATRDCKVGVATIFPILVADPVCQNATLQASGKIDYNGARTFSIKGSLDVGASYIHLNATTSIISMDGTTNQTISSATTWPGILTIANTGGGGSNTVSLASSVTVTGAVNVNSGILQIPNGMTLTVGGNVTIASGATLDIEPGGILKFSTDESVLTVNTGGILEMTGTSGSYAQVTSSSTAIDYWINVNGTIRAQYYSVTNVGVVGGTNTGLTIQSGATISTGNLQNGSFNYPVDNSTKFLVLLQQVPTNTLDGCAFNANASAATTVKNVSTGAAVAAGTLSMTGFSGDRGDVTYEQELGSYAISWSSPTNTIDLTQEATGPATVNQGTTYTMGRFGFKQTQAGAYADVDITSLKLTLTGTGSASDITTATIYWDSGCTGSGGTSIGSGTFSGTPATKTFTISAGAATIPYAAVAPTLKRCIYVTYAISGTAVNAKTVGVQIAASTDVVTNPSYLISGGTPPPVTLGTASTIVGTTTTWTGTTSTAWATAGNWNGGVPTSTLNCTIPSAANAPTISAAGAYCKTVNITTGNLTISGSNTLEVYGDFLNTGTFTQGTGTLSIRDDGVTATTQTIKSGTATVTLTTSSKTVAGGTLAFSGTSVIANNPFTLAGSDSFNVSVPNAATVSFNNGLTISGKTFTVAGGGTVKLASAKTLTVSGGTLTISGTNDVFGPTGQTSTNKGKITNTSGTNTWAFNATSGTLSLTGFYIDYLDASGLNISGSANLTALDGGQFTNLATNGKGLQINTSGSVPATSDNVSFQWGAFNATNAGTTCLAGSYYTVYAPACGGNTITFSQWAGNWWPGTVVGAGCVPGDKIYDSVDVGPTCTISMAASASPVALSSLTATPYNAKVSVDWATVSELDHMGFNVYRTTDLSSGAVQVNPTIIRNTTNSTNGQGVYRYLDSNVTNDTTYYYYLEDVAFNGGKVMHGPISATPNATLGNAPATPGDTIGSGSSGNPDNGNGPTNGTIETPGAVDLGNGVHLLTQTATSLRVEIVPPAESYSQASWDNTYQVLSLPGYSSTTTVGSPELAERTIMIEVDSSVTSAQVSNSSVTEGAPAVHKIQPAPLYTLTGGVLVPSWTEDATVYGTNSFMPANYYTVDTAITTISGKKYVKILATPIKFNPTTDSAKKATRIVLDIGLNGGAWDAPTPPVDVATSPALVDGTLRIRFNRTGLYQLTYAQMAAANVEGPFAGANTANFRMYMKGSEIPIEIRAANASSFSSGDSIRFYVYYSKPLNDDENEIVLSKVNLFNVGTSPLRFTPTNADPTGVALTSETYTWMHASADVTDLNHSWVYENPSGSDWDHIYWKQIKRRKDGTTNITLTASVNLPLLANSSTAKVRLNIDVIGGVSNTYNPIHHLGVWINGTPFMVGDTTFQTNMLTTVTVEVPATYFSYGVNSITLKALADLIEGGNDDQDRIYIDKIEVDYKGYRKANLDYADIYNGYLNTSIDISSFTSNTTTSIYDVTDATDVLLLTNVQYTLVNGSYTAQFAGNAGASYNHGRRFIGVEDTKVLSPVSLQLGYGAAIALGSSVNGADLIVIGTEQLLDAALPLIQRRQSEGLRVVSAPLEQIYVEFGHGIRSAQAIRDFVQYAINNWQAPAPTYLLLLGDSSADPNNFLQLGYDPNALPVHWQTGDYMDFAGDNWFAASSAATEVPLMSVGRIPAKNASELDGYVQKLLDYEDSTSSLSTSTNNLAFVADKDSIFSESYLAKTQSISQSVTTEGAIFTTSIVDRTTLASDAATKAAVVDLFNNNNFTIAYVGHGSEYNWMSTGATRVFGNADAAALTNSHKPIAIGLNCLNAKIYDLDETSLGEALVMNSSGGAIAFWGASTETVPEVQMALSKAFINELNTVSRTTYRTVRLGDLTTRAKIAISAQKSHLDTVRSWNFLGDPTMKLPPTVFSPESASQSSTSKKKGFLSCGSIDLGSSGGIGSGPNWPAFFEMLALVGGLILVRRRLLSAQA